MDIIDGWVGCLGWGLCSCVLFFIVGLIVVEVFGLFYLLRSDLIGGFVLWLLDVACGLWVLFGVCGLLDWVVC